MIGLFTAMEVDDAMYFVTVEAIVRFNDEDYAKIRWLDDGAVTFEPAIKLVEGNMFFDNIDACRAFYKPKETTND